MPLKEITDDKGKVIGILDTDTGQQIPIKTELTETRRGIEEKTSLTPDTSTNFNLGNFLRDLTPEVVGGVAGEGIRAVTKNALGRLNPARFLGPLAGSVAGNYGATALLDPNNATLNKSIGSGVMDRVSGRAFEALGSGIDFMRQGEGSIRRSMELKLGKMFPQTDAEIKTTKSAFEFADEFGAPTPTAMAFGSDRAADLMGAAISPPARVSHFNRVAAAEERAMRKMLPFEIAKFDVLPYDTARHATKRAQAFRRVMESNEKKAWNTLEPFKEMASIQVHMPAPMKEIDTGIIGPNGQTIKDTVVDVDLLQKRGQLDMLTALPNGDPVIAQPIKGPIKINNPQGWAQFLQQEGQEVLGKPAEYFPSDLGKQDQITRLMNAVKSIAETPPDLMTGDTIVPYVNTKTLRNEIQQTLRNIHDPKVSGALERLQGLLSAAEKESIGNTSLGWDVNAIPAYEAAKRSTQDRVKIFSPPNARNLATTQTVTDPVSLAIKGEEEVAQSLRTVQGAKEFASSMGGDARLIQERLLIDGWHKAFDTATGTLDGKKMEEFFYDKATNEGIVRELFTKDQRAVLRHLTNYAKAGKLKTGAGYGDYANVHMASGVISMLAGGLELFRTGSVTRGLVLGGGFAIGLPMMREAFGKLVLDEKGAKLLMQRLYPTSQKQAIKTSKEIIQLLGVGTRVFAINAATGEHIPATIDENHKLVPDEPQN